MSDEELIRMVSDLNDCLPPKLNEELGLCFSLWCNGYTSVVLFNDYPLWNEDNDERPWDEEGDDYAISVKDWVIQEFKKMTELMSAADFK
jgi:hypothetical protein